MAFQTFTAVPPFPPDTGRTRAQIGVFWVDYTGAVPPTLAQVQAQATPKKIVPTLLALFTSINALTTAQKNTIWTNFTSGTPAKWSLSNGPNASGIFVMHFLATSGLAAADILNAKGRAVAMYVQDNPLYLVNPTFAPTINIPGRT